MVWLDPSAPEVIKHRDAAAAMLFHKLNPGFLLDPLRIMFSVLVEFLR
jgi:hypothetical protein